MHRLTKIGRFLRTIRWLKPKQAYYRVYYSLRRILPFGNSGKRWRGAAPPNFKTLSPCVPFLKYTPFAAASIAAGRFSFLNIPAEYGAKILWDDRQKSRLWRYNLHYFNYLMTRDDLPFSICLPLMRSWIQENSPGAPDVWDAFPTSLRLVNWIKYLSQSFRSHDDISDIIGSLYGQTFWLEKLMEYHLLANHLFKNAKALLFAGLFFTGPDAERWRSAGVKLLKEEIAEQILPDGGHFERSPMYHSMILEDCLDLLNVSGQCEDLEIKSLANDLRAAASRMTEFLCGMTHPDGEIALFNDAAFGIEAKPKELMDYCERVTGESIKSSKGHAWSFPDTGYYVMAPKDGDRLMIDCGKIGPDYQPGHSHCDLLSFELSLKGRRVIVDSGCCGYEDTAIRQYNRGNPGHNTVTIDGENQSEVWGAHRCGSRARPIHASLKKHNGGMIFEGAHDGYKHLGGGPIHCRRIEWRGDLCLFADEINGSGRHDIEARLHINPDLKIEGSADSIRIYDDIQDLLVVSTMDGSRIEVADGWSCPEFGRKLPCKVLLQKFQSINLPFKLGWKFLIS